MTIGRGIITAQGAYYLLTGVWPLVSIETFERVTGPKTDRWLVYTVGLLAASIGAALIMGSRSNPLRGETLLLGALTALSFGTIDVVFVTNGTIDSIYLVDAGVQAALVILILACKLQVVG